MEPIDLERQQIPFPASKNESKNSSAYDLKMVLLKCIIESCVAREIGVPSFEFSFVNKIIQNVKGNLTTV